MYRLMRFFNQNKRGILIAVIIIALFLIGLQLLDSYVANNSQENISQNNNVNQSINTGNRNINVTSTNTSALGNSISPGTVRDDTEIITSFIENCNNGNLEEAYNMLTDSCKENLYSSLESFKNNYYSKIFDGKTKSIKVEAWTADTYRVTIKEDILATGKNDGKDVKQDYITIERNGNDEYKLNINGYVGKEEINKTTDKENIKITIKSKDVFMDYEIYTIEIENSSDNEILLDRKLNPETIYLQDENEIKYPAYNTELTEQQLTIGSKEKKTTDIKFYSKFSTTKNIERVVFSDVVLNNEEYTSIDNKDSYKTINIMINV